MFFKKYILTLSDSVVIWVIFVLLAVQARVKAEDITVNVGENAKMHPVPPEGEQWKAVIHNDKVGIFFGFGFVLPLFLRPLFSYTTHVLIHTLPMYLYIHYNRTYTYTTHVPIHTLLMYLYIHCRYTYTIHVPIHTLLMYPYIHYTCIYTYTTHYTCTLLHTLHMYIYLHMYLYIHYISWLYVLLCRDNGKK